MTIGERIVEQRKKLGMTRVQLAQDLNIPHTTLRNYETDQREPGHKTLISLSQRFGVTTDYLLGMEKDVEIEKTPARESTEDEKNIQMIVSGLTELLVKAGWVADGGDLTDSQLRTLASYVIGLNAYFNGQS